MWESLKDQTKWPWRSLLTRIPMGEGLQQPLHPESCAQLFIIILTLQRTPLSLAQLHCRNDRHLGSQQPLNSSSKKDQDSSTKTRRDRRARPHHGHIPPFAWPQASPAHPLTVHPADAEHFKHGKEQQARATAGVIIKQLEDVHPALGDKRQSETSAGGQGTCPSPHETTEAHLPGPGNSSLAAKKRLPRLSLTPSLPALI